MTWLAGILASKAFRVAFPYVMLGTGVLVGVLWIQGRAYDRGVADTEARVDVAEQAHQARVTSANDEIARINAAADVRIAEAVARRPRIIREFRRETEARPDLATARLSDRAVGMWNDEVRRQRGDADPVQ